MWENKKLLKNINEKLEKQDKIFTIDGKDLDLKKLLGLEVATSPKEEEKKEEVKPTWENNTAFVEMEKLKEPVEEPKPKKKIKRLPSFNDEFKLPEREEWRKNIFVKSARKKLYQVTQ